MSDLELLRRFEPVVRFTQGEHFFPMDVDRYVSECSLWEACPDEPPERLVPETQLTLAKLAEPRPAPHGAVHYLRFVEALTPFEAARFVAKQRRAFKRSRGRLARVGLTSRIIDALFSITLILRGRVPGGTAAAAHDVYQRLQEKDERYVYYGRAVRQGGFVCLQYWFFYCMNDWRSSFYGVNDHESDWEQIIVYLSEDLAPQWVAYASHDFTGDDLRRRWDDPELRREGDHPIIFAGAGSHASYFSSGEYMHEVALPFSGPLTRFVRAAQKFWRGTLRQGEAEEENEKEKPRASGVLVVPFVDYARGDGLKIGPGGDKSWEARLLPDTHDRSPDHPQAWTHHYRGLWGLFARDPIAGENAPAGPKYNRDGSVRRSWFDPLGWAGLDKVTPPSDLSAAIAERCEAIRKREAESQTQVAEKMTQLRALGLEAEATLAAPHFKPHHAEHLKQITELSESIEALRKRTAVDHALLEALEMYSARVNSGERLPARSHIKTAHHPSTEETEQLGRLAEAWAALSVGLLILGFIIMLIAAPRFWLNGLVSLVAVISFLEALFRREAKEMIQRGVVGLSLLAAAVLIYEFALPLLVLGIIALGVFIIVENVRELTG
ncbi:MAG: hypothetical protein FJ030_10655 [Chloroflexi bacterium]|nr:hypothetical protein [Chloroflexota bacterium]